MYLASLLSRLISIIIAATRTLNTNNNDNKSDEATTTDKNNNIDSNAVPNLLATRVGTRIISQSYP